MNTESISRWENWKKNCQKTEKKDFVSIVKVYCNKKNMMYKTLLILNVLHAENSKIQMLKKWKIIIQKFHFIFRLSTTLKYRPQRAEVNKNEEKTDTYMQHKTVWFIRDTLSHNIYEKNNYDVIQSKNYDRFLTKLISILVLILILILVLVLFLFLCLFLLSVPVLKN